MMYTMKLTLSSDRFYYSTPVCHYIILRNLRHHAFVGEKELRNFRPRQTDFITVLLSVMTSYYVIYAITRLSVKKNYPIQLR